MGLTRRGTRFVSDSLRFTGTDLGDRASGLTRRGGQGSDEEDSTSDDYDEDDYDLALMDPEEKEEALVQTAMARIQRAQAKGKADVSLTKEELAALERRKQRMKEEAEKKERKKRKEQRVAVPLTHLEPVSRKKKHSQQALESSSRNPSASDLTAAQEGQVYPPMGYFPPPSSGRTRPRSGTSLSHRPPSRARDGRGSPPYYDYTQRPASSTGRHVSDSVARPRSSNSNVSSRNLDPFMFQTAGPRAPHSGGAAAASRRHGSGPTSDALYMTRREAATAASSLGTRSSRNRRSMYDETSDEGSIGSSQSTSDDFGNGARIREPASRGGGGGGERASRRSNEILVEPEPEPEPPKKKSSEATTKRKTASSRGRRKKK